MQHDGPESARASSADRTVNGERSRRDWLALSISVLVMFVSATNVTDPNGLGWDFARAIAAVAMLTALFVWFKAPRRESAEDWERQRWF